MKKCPVCGNPMADDELFCASCGAKWEEPAPATDPTPADGSAPADSFCPNCGGRVSAGTVFCPNCGANLNGGPKPKKPFNAKPIGIAVAGVAAVAAIVLVVNLLGGLFASPAKKFVAAQTKLLQEGVLAPVAAVADNYNKAAKGFSGDLIFTADCDDPSVSEVLDGTELVLKVDTTIKSALINGELTLMGEPVLSGAVTYDKGKIGFCLPEADENYYVMSLESLAELMGMDPDYFEEASKAETPKLPTAELNKVYKAYLDIITGVVTEENTEKSEKKSIKLEELGEKVDGELYVFKPEAEDIEDMLNKLADRLEEDEDLRKLVADYVDDNRETLEAAFSETGYDLDDLEDDLDEALKELAEEIRNSAEDAGKALEELDFTWKLGISKGKVCLERIEMKNGGGAMVMAYESTGEQSVFYVEEDGEKEFTARMERKEKGGMLEGYIAVTSRSYYYGDYIEDTVRLDFEDVNLKKTSALGLPYGVFTLEAEGQRVELEVAKGEDGGTDHTLRLPDDFYMDDVGYVDGLEFTLNTSDKKSTAAKPRGKAVDISDYDEEELAELINDISAELEDVFADVAGELMPDNYYEPADRPSDQATPPMNPDYDW